MISIPSLACVSHVPNLLTADKQENVVYDDVERCQLTSSEDTGKLKTNLFHQMWHEIAFGSWLIRYPILLDIKINRCDLV